MYFRSVIIGRNGIRLQGLGVYQDAALCCCVEFKSVARGRNHTIDMPTRTRASRKWKSFREARKFARQQELSGEYAWREYCKRGQGRQRLPEDIPTNPDRVYRDSGWESWGDFLGTGNLHYASVEWRPLMKARKYVHTLKLKSETDWRKLIRGELKRKKLPQDIPMTPDRVYASQWKGWGDFLGTGTLSNKKKHEAFWSFEKARRYVQKLKLSSRSEWNAFCAGKIKGLPEKPEQLPRNPHRTYASSGWEGYGDWLGTGTIAPFLRVYRKFNSARAFARQLKLKSRSEWWAYCRGELKGYPTKPEDIPSSPNQTYADKGWLGWPDWLGKK